MDFGLSKELTMLKKAVSEFAKKKIAPFADEWDQNNYFPYQEAIRPMGELGFFGTVIPEAYGGENMGWLAAMIVTEEIAKASSSLRVQVNMQVLAALVCPRHVWMRPSNTATPASNLENPSVNFR